MQRQEFLEPRPRNQNPEINQQVVTRRKLSFFGVAHYINVTSTSHQKNRTSTHTRDQLLGCAPIFTSAWLFIEIDRALTPAQTQFTNSDGDDLLFHDLRYPLACGVTQKAVAERLDRVKGFVPEGPKFWNWLAARRARGGKAGGDIMLDTQMEGATVLGSLELAGKTLLVTVNYGEAVWSVRCLGGADRAAAAAGSGTGSVPDRRSSPRGSGGGCWGLAACAAGRETRPDDVCPDCGIGRAGCVRGA